MDEIIQTLDSRIQRLVKECNHLREANERLRLSKLQLVREKEFLFAKHKMAITQIETMVSRLKSIENKDS